MKSRMSPMECLVFSYYASNLNFYGSIYLVFLLTSSCMHCVQCIIFVTLILATYLSNILAEELNMSAGLCNINANKLE